jgi:acid phosphatase
MAVRRIPPLLVSAIGLVALGAAGCSSTTNASPAIAHPAAPPAVSSVAHLPKPDHVVVVLFENKEEKQVAGSSSAPYFNELAARGASFTDSTGVTHPSQPNYLALFSGSTQGVPGDGCLRPGVFAGPDLGGELIAAGKTFTGYAESMPSDAAADCSSGKYASKHNPWRDFQDVPAASSKTFASFPEDFTQLPTVSLVVPNMCDDMHDCGVATGDAWLKANLSAYADWAPAHNSELIVTFDEDDFTDANVIPTTILGAGVKPGPSAQHIDHYSVLRTIEDMYGLPLAGNSAQAEPVSGIWN